jgi:predicted amidophosphoribosyltransferase
MSTNNECGICFHVKPLVKSCCQGPICRLCIDEIRKRYDSCPYCRKKFSTKNVYRQRLGIETNINNNNTFWSFLTFGS